MPLPKLIGPEFLMALEMQRPRFRLLHLDDAPQACFYLADFVVLMEFLFNFRNFFPQFFICVHVSFGDGPYFPQKLRKIISPNFF